MTLPWKDLIRRSLEGGEITRAEGRMILSLSDDGLPELLHAAFEVRKARFGKRVKVCVLQNAQSGNCSENCGYCSQSSSSSAPIEKYPLMTKKMLVDGARRAFEARAGRYCMVTSGRGSSDNDIEQFCDAVREIKAKFALELCVSVGMISGAQAQMLKEAGVDWVNHNLNTSERFHLNICTTHSYKDRVNTIKNVQKAGLLSCSGGIIGMGETDEDILDLAFAVREMSMDAIPINFLNPIKGTPMEGCNFLTPIKCLKVLCLFRFLNPSSDIRAAGGREVNLRSLQPLALYPASSIFAEGYLTTAGQGSEDACRMIEDMGFEVESREIQALAT